MALDEEGSIHFANIAGWLCPMTDGGVNLNSDQWVQLFQYAAATVSGVKPTDPSLLCCICVRGEHRSWEFKRLLQRIETTSDGGFVSFHTGAPEEQQYFRTFPEALAATYVSYALSAVTQIMGLHYPSRPRELPSWLESKNFVKEEIQEEPNSKVLLDEVCEVPSDETLGQVQKLLPLEEST